MKDVLPVDKYNNLLTLHTALLILIDPKLCQLNIQLA